MPQTLTHRAETALIGALLTDRTLLADVGYLSYADLADPDHQQVFKTIADLRISRPDLEGAALARAVAQAAQIPGIDADYLTSVAARCPDAAAVTVYGRMVLEAALRRDLAAHAEALSRQAVPGQSPSAAEHAAMLADSLHAHGHELERLEAHVTPPDHAHDTVAIASAERDILADLLQRPEMLSETTWLGVEVFADDTNRKVYEAIRAVEARGEPIQELTIAWELGRRQALDELAGRSGASPSAATGPDSGYLERLATTPVDAGTAITAGQELLTAHTRGVLADEAARVIAQAINNDAAPARAEPTVRLERSPSHGHLPQVQLLPPLQPVIQDPAPRFVA
ncbi:MAG: hypothetical protein AUG49_13925 [Catenulispora sp. 13_1_20CM_3_70_7]|nr:MAG: hypothetical protein AUG49_13925 [Catenulispora sp. 13_1_20CM_3_70_7]